MEDITGRIFYWQRRQERPLICSLYEDSTQVGIVEERLLIHQMYATFAGVTWDIDFPRMKLRVGFSNGQIVVAESDNSPWAFCLTVDSGETYQLVSPRPKLAEWRNAGGNVVASLLSSDLLGSAGEISIASDAPLLHAPLFVIVGALRAVRRQLFRLAEPAKGM